MGTPVVPPSLATDSENRYRLMGIEELQSRSDSADGQSYIRRISHLDPDIEHMTYFP